MRLYAALLAGLPQRELNAVFDTGRISKSAQRATMALRAGDPTGTTGRRRVFDAICKQYVDDASVTALGNAIYTYARKKVEEMPPMTAPKTIAEDDLLNERVDKAHGVQKVLHQAITKYQEVHGCSRERAIDAVLLSPEVSKSVVLERQMDALAKAKNTLRQPGPTTNIDFGGPPRGRTDYDSSADGRPPHNPDDGEEVSGHGHNQLLEDIKSGKVPFSDPRVSALHRLERKRRLGE